MGTAAEWRRFRLGVIGSLELDIVGSALAPPAAIPIMGLKRGGDDEGCEGVVADEENSAFCNEGGRL